MNKVYIVEDDPVIAKTVASHLKGWQMECQCTMNFENIIEEMKAFEPDIILMDIKLPYYNGFYWCAEIRKISNVPIVFVSSADDNMNIVMAMNMGADDFISKPFDLQVLTVKLQAVLRRSYGKVLERHVLECGDVLLNLDDTSMMIRDQRLELTKNEFLMLKVLLEKQGKVVSREEMMERLWGDDEFIDDNTLTVNMVRLRKKMESAGLTDFIVTKRGLGYIVGEA
ncbi:MAG: response regulator transcription factor [Lachnospiraceae bacterium]|nr:response regulator transcription factor [Lachnospiraceae bacterium]